MALTHVQTYINTHTSPHSICQIATPSLIAVLDYPALKREAFKDFVSAIVDKECVLHSASMDMRLIGHYGGKGERREKFACATLAR